MKRTLFIPLLFVLTLANSFLCADSIAAPVTPSSTDTVQVDEIEVFSDTTSADSSAFDDSFFDTDDFDDDPMFSGTTFNMHDDLRDIVDDSLPGMFFVLAVLIIIFVLSPIVIIGLILWFIYKSRKNRMRLAEIAMKNGQPIPDELVHTASSSGSDLREKGVRQVFLGIGLIFLLGWVAGKIGAGIGIVVLCIGLGNVLIARTSKQNQEQVDRDIFPNNSNNI